MHDGFVEMCRLIIRVSMVVFPLCLLFVLGAVLGPACESPFRMGEEVSGSAGSLIVYSGRSETLVGPLIEQFRDATGIDVSVKYGKTGEIAVILMEEGTNSRADVFFAQDPGGLGAVVNAGMFTKLPDDILSLVPDWAESKDGLWVGISSRVRTLVYNNERMTQNELPDSLNGLTEPKWKGRVGWAPTNGSFQAMITAMRVIWGEPRTKEWLKGIQANEPKIYPKNTPQVAAVESGEIDVGLVNHYYLHRFLEEHGESFSARNYHFRSDGPGSLVMVAGAGIIKTGKSRQNAERFLKFMLSRVGQQYFASQTFEYPLVEGVTVNQLLTPLSEINQPGISMKQLADLEGTQKLLRDVGIIP